jgi:hypothetical protein
VCGWQKSAGTVERVSAGADGGCEFRVGLECLCEAFELCEFGFELDQFEGVVVSELLCVLPADEGW